MPLSPEQAAAVKLLAEADPKEVAEAMKADAASAYQAVYQSGFTTAHKDAKTKLSAKDEEVARLAAELAERGEEIARLGAAQPDFAAEKQRLTDALTKAKQEAEAAKAEASERVKAVHKQKALADVRAALVSKDVDPEYAEMVLAAKAAERVRVAEDGAVAFLDADGLTPLQNGLDGLAAQLVAGLDAKWLRSKADGGAGVTPGGHAGPAVGRSFEQSVTARAGALSF